MSLKRKEAERNKKIIDVTFNSAPPLFTNFAPGSGWNWKIPHNPKRKPPVWKETPGKWTKEELEVTDLAKNKTPQKREVSRIKTYTYWAPFNYPNAKVELGRPETGCEFNPDGVELDVYPYGSITITEKEPIVSVTVIGSGCSAPSYLVLEAEPLVWKFPRTGVRMIKKDLWGVHVRGDAWFAGITENWGDAGLSSARFDIPESKKVIIGGASFLPDPHYCVRIIRIEVKEKF